MMCIFGCAHNLERIIFLLYARGITLCSMGSKLGVGDIDEWLLISLLDSHPCPGQPR
jgi:hypothetical protein